MAELEDYKLKLETIKESYSQLSTEAEIKDLFKGITIIFIKEIIQLYNKLLKKLPHMKFSKSSEKISNLNTLLESLESDGRLFNIDVNDIIIRSYISYFFIKYRDDMMNWDLEKIAYINEDKFKEVVVDGVTSENVANTQAASEYLNIIPEIILMVNNLKPKDILKLLYILNNLNVIVDIYLVKKSQGTL
jgi:hypothetical protein